MKTVIDTNIAFYVAQHVTANACPAYENEDYLFNTQHSERLRDMEDQITLRLRANSGINAVAHATPLLGGASIEVMFDCGDDDAEWNFANEMLRAAMPHTQVVCTYALPWKMAGPGETLYPGAVDFHAVIDVCDPRFSPFVVPSA